MATLTEIRKGRGLRLDDVRTATGVDISSVSRIERGQMPRTPGRAAALAKFYGIDLPSFYAAVAEGAAAAQPAEAA